MLLNAKKNTTGNYLDNFASKIKINIMLVEIAVVRSNQSKISMLRPTFYFI